MENTTLKRVKDILRRKNTGKYIFIFLTMVWPVVQFLVFYVYVNANSIFLAFQRYDGNNSRYVFLPINDLFRNIKYVIQDFTSLDTLIMATKNSFLLFLTTGIGVFPLHIFIAYSIYKKCRFSAFFTIILMLPSMVPGIVFLMIFRYLVEYGTPIILGDPRFPSLISNPETAFGTMIFYMVWVGFAGSLVIYLGSMSRIPPSLIEYGQMEGINAVREIWYIVLPMMFPMFTVIVIGWVVGIFSGQGVLYTFYEDGAPANIQTIGYYFFIQIIGTHSTAESYPYAAAAGLLFTLIAAPITLMIRWAMEKFGPNPEY